MKPFPRPQPSGSPSSPSLMGDEVDALGKKTLLERNAVNARAQTGGRCRGVRALVPFWGLAGPGPGVCPHLRGEFSPREREAFLFSALPCPILARGTKEG